MADEDKNDEVFSDMILAGLENINHLPLNGVSRLDDPNMISVDPFGSLVAFVHMATSYSAL
jgi:hypothetical protein